MTQAPYARSGNAGSGPGVLEGKSTRYTPQPPLSPTKFGREKMLKRQGRCRIGIINRLYGTPKNL